MSSDENPSDSPTTSSPQPQPPQQEPPITKEQLMTLHLENLKNTLNTLDSLDKIIASLVNVQGFVMNIKEKIKQDQLGLDQANNNKQQPQQQPEK